MLQPCLPGALAGELAGIPAGPGWAARWVRRPARARASISGRPPRPMTRRASPASGTVPSRRSRSSACLTNPYPSTGNRQGRTAAGTCWALPSGLTGHMT